MQASPHATPLALPAPYEPLIRMYEQGGHFYAEQGFLYRYDFSYLIDKLLPLLSALLENDQGQYKVS